MRLIKQSFEIIDQGYTKEDILKHIEKCGRVCYKSEDKITDDSYIRFCEMLKNNNHLSCYEHGTVYLKAKNRIVGHDERDECPLTKYENNKYSIVKRDCIYAANLYVTTNLRVIIENGWEDDLQYLCESTEYHEKRVTVKMICPISISREFNRHRKFSISEQSTRYCNYNKDKFNNELTFIRPYWMDKEDLSITSLSAYNHSLSEAETSYLKLIDEGFKPQEARGVLPLDTATEVVYTGFVSDWKYFFKLRDSQAAHPQARELASSIRKEFINRGLVSL